MKGRPLPRWLCDSHILALCIPPCGKRSSDLLFALDRLHRGDSLSRNSAKSRLIQWMYSILVVDDEDGMRQLLDTALTRAGYVVHQCGDGADVFALLKERRIDLLITDLFMCETDGLETIMKVRKDFPTLRVIAISGGTRRSRQAYLPIALKLGADAALYKPLDLPLLLKTVKELLAPHTKAAA